MAIAHVEPSADPSAYGLLDYAVIFVTRSDGAVDADRAGGERFDTARVIELITRHSRSSPTELTAALWQAVADFTGAARADDDRTGLVVKRC